MVHSGSIREDNLAKVYRKEDRLARKKTVGKLVRSEKENVYK